MKYDFSDYQKMYDLGALDLSKSIVHFSTAISDFNVEATKQGIYVIDGNTSQLPHLPYITHQFELALCTDFIFYHSHTGEEIAIIVKELCRVASEVRIFPLLDSQRKMSAELGSLLLTLQKKNYGVEVREVPFNTLAKGNAMLRVWEQECKV